MIPQLLTPAVEWQHYALWERIRRLLPRIPHDFRSTLSISGINATELYAFGAVLGLTIEQEVVRTLNGLKSEWDSEGQYSAYRFVRQAQTFPDVLLRKVGAPEEIIMGIELKSWYLLAKEGEPSFRFTVTPGVCAPQDMLVIVPWALSSVLSGTPVIFNPFVTSARYVADYRNYWWQSVRKIDTSRSIDIVPPANVSFYPVGHEEIADKPLEDKGKNFGRIARLGIMDEYVKAFDHEPLLGLDIATWRQFFKQASAPEFDS